MKIFQIVFKHQQGTGFNAELINTFNHENISAEQDHALDILFSDIALCNPRFIRALGASTPDEVLINVDDIANIKITTI